MICLSWISDSISKGQASQFTPTQPTLLEIPLPFSVGKVWVDSLWQIVVE